MSQFVYVVAYLSIIVFFVAVVKKIKNYLDKPIHVRWELYPVAHEGGGRDQYGGSYLEDVGWWGKERDVSMIGELKVMIPEILLLKAVWEHNRPLWYATYPFHLGLYLIVGFIGTLLVTSVSGLIGLEHAFYMLPVSALTNLLGPAGFILCIAGALGLIYKRMTDPGLKNYSSPGHFFNLMLFIVTMGVATLTWLFVDPSFQLTRQFVSNLISFNIAPIDSSLFMVQVILGVLTLAYIPLTHMSHFFMKYFLYHDIRWGDEPNINTPKTDAKIGIVLNYPVSWSASHIAGHGKETWAEVATFNPAAEPEEGKE
ncbi:MAG: respiratory nitrate reductase subunit gamma [Proteobacteria bacterium]|nr:respiratory nitrate reductase subunit gamma [Pseudomonadota bacterium]